MRRWQPVLLVVGVMLLILGFEYDGFVGVLLCALGGASLGAYTATVEERR